MLHSLKPILLVPFLLVVTVAPPAWAQTKVDVPLNTKRGVFAPPSCDGPCVTNFDLPAFARQLALAGPDGSFQTDLTRQTFLLILEDWRRHVEEFRQTVERKQRTAADWSDANVLYQVEIGKYEQFFESYRNAYAMDRTGRIRYGSNEAL